MRRRGPVVGGRGGGEWGPSLAPEGVWGSQPWQGPARPPYRTLRGGGGEGMGSQGFPEGKKTFVTPT